MIKLRYNPPMQVIQLKLKSDFMNTVGLKKAFFGCKDLLAR